MVERKRKWLAKQFIKECQDPELNFSKKELEVIKKTAKVVLYDNDSFWELSVEANYYEDVLGGSPKLWGHFVWHKNEAEGKMEILSGRYDTVCSIHDSYTCTRPQGTNYIKEFDTLIEFIKKARKAEVFRIKDYTDYVARTGDMS